MNRREFLAAAAVAPLVGVAPAVVEVPPSGEPFDVVSDWVWTGYYANGWALRRMAKVVLHCSYEGGELKRRRGRRLPGADVLRLTYDYSNDEVAGLIETLYEGPVADDFDETPLYAALRGFAWEVDDVTAIGAVIAAASDLAARANLSTTYRSVVAKYGPPPVDNEIGMMLDMQKFYLDHPPRDLGAACE